VVTVNSCGILPRDHPVVVELEGLHIDTSACPPTVETKRVQKRSKKGKRVEVEVE
jgi:hypothetical protein